MKKIKLEQIDSALQALENAPIVPVETSVAHGISSTGSVNGKRKGVVKNRMDPKRLLRASQQAFVLF